MGNEHELRQIAPRCGVGGWIAVRPGQVDAARALVAAERYTRVEPGPDGRWFLAIASGGKMYCGYDGFLDHLGALAPHLEDALLYVTAMTLDGFWATLPPGSDEEQFIDELLFEAGRLCCTRVYSGPWRSTAIDDLLRGCPPPVTGYRRHLLGEPPTRYYARRKLTRYFVLAVEAALSAELCGRVDVLLREHGLRGPDAPSPVIRGSWLARAGEPHTYGELLEDHGELAGLDEMLARGRVTLLYYLERRELDGATEASLVRVLLYPVPGAPPRTRLHVTPEAGHLHDGFGHGSADPACDWDFALYRDGPVRALIVGLPARLEREADLGRASDAIGRELDDRERVGDELYWPGYRVRALAQR